MKFKKLIEEQNRLNCLKNRGELTDYGLEMLTELSQALQLLQTGVIKSVCEHDGRIDGNVIRCTKCKIALSLYEQTGL